MPPPRRETPKKAKAPARRGGGMGRLLLRWGAVASIWGFMAALFVLAWFAHDLPDISRAVQAERRPAVTLVDAAGTPFHRFGDLRGATVDVHSLPRHLIDAVVATEDRRFWSHFGLDPVGILRAAVANWQAGRVVQGGSTLTQQLAKNLFLTPDQTMKRKIQEALLALWLERTYTKDQILSAYLNRVYLGAGTYGVDAAARTYFNKPATQLSLRESAIIAGLLKAPSRYTPTANPDRAEARMMVVLNAMVEEGYITEEDVAAASDDIPVPGRKPGSTGDGRYYAAWVADQVGAFVGPDHGDLIVYTTFDPAIQRAAERHIAQLLRDKGAEAAVQQGAAVVMRPDGAVVALVGGRDYDGSQFNRAAQALRQPGSAFKPFVFLAALEAGYGPDSRVLDAPYRKGKWAPGNYDGRFRGEVTLREALAQSLNTATIRLMEATGVDQVRGMARRLGITADMRRDLSLALGTSEVTLLELTGAYATFANGGRAVIPFGIQEVRDSNGRLLYRRQGSGAGLAVSAQDVAAMNQLLLGPITVGTGKAARLDRMAAGKTGTTQDYKDAWFIGFTADYVAGVWLGNDSGAPMKKVTGGSLPALLWRDIMTEAHQGLPPRDLPGLSTTPLLAETHALPVPADPPAQDAAGTPPSADAIGDLLRRLGGGN